MSSLSLLSWEEGLSITLLRDCCDIDLECRLNLLTAFICKYKWLTKGVHAFFLFLQPTTINTGTILEMALLISSSVTSVTIAALFSSSEINGSCPCFVTQGSTLTVQLKFTHYPMFVYITRSSDIAIRFSGSFSNSLCRSMTSSGFVLLSYSTLCNILFELCAFLPLQCALELTDHCKF